MQRPRSVGWNGEIKARVAQIKKELAETAKASGAAFAATCDVADPAMCASATVIAERLAGHPRVTGVRFPGLPGDPSYAIQSRQARITAGGPQT